jgi:hypothetical protein
MGKKKNVKKDDQGEDSTAGRIKWTAEMLGLFYEEASARQLAINRAMTRSSSCPCSKHGADLRP